MVIFFLQLSEHLQIFETNSSIHSWTSQISTILSVGQGRRQKLEFKAGFSHGWWEASYLSHHYYLSSSTLVGIWSWNPEPGTELRHSIVRYGDKMLATLPIVFTWCFILPKIELF